MGIGMMAVSNLGAWISRTRGPKITLATAGIVIAAGCGIGLAFGAMPALIMSSVPGAEKAAANGFNSLMGSIGTTASAAIIGVVLGSMVQQTGAHPVPTQAGFLTALLIGCGGALIAAAIAAAIPIKARATADQHAAHWSRPQQRDDHEGIAVRGRQADGGYRLWFCHFQEPDPGIG